MVSTQLSSPPIREWESGRQAMAGEEEGREEECQQLEIKTSSSNPRLGLSWLMSQSFPTLKYESKTSLTSDETVWKIV